jgi:putative FmdB family regulatory protein
MPIYEYACGKCRHEFEVEQRITDDPVRSCPECRSRKVKRLISQTSFVLKGSGWYSDLYSSPKGDAPADKKESTDKPADAAPASDAKSETKSKSKDKDQGKGKGKGKGSKAAA